MKQKLLDEINYEREWKKTLFYKLSFGKFKPSNAWKFQLKRIYERKRRKNKL
tara:strand:+ start:57 stop:212 length:156 start_codon:yes stop_codon:yes gene_type:complete